MDTLIFDLQDCAEASTHEQDAATINAAIAEIKRLREHLQNNTRPLEFVQMSELDEQSLDLIRRYVGLIDEMEGRGTTSRDAADLDAERAELHNEIIARLQAKRITWDKRGDVTDWCYTVVRWYGK